jgi:hypothetical protein
MIGMGTLQPVVALAAWTMVMWLWMYATRIPALTAAKVDAANWVGGTGKDLDEMLPPQVQWKAHNYNHLHESPTLFYAVAILLALISEGDGINVTLSWVYVGLRIAHSLIQATVNKVMLRFAVFALSSLCLMALVVRAGVAVF